MDEVLNVKREPDDPVGYPRSELPDQQTEVLSTSAVWPEHRDILRMRLIKKEEQLEDTIGEELIGTCDVEEPKVEPISEDELEMALNSDKSLPLTDCKEEMLTAESENSDKWEPEEKHNKQFTTEINKQAQAVNSEKLKKILNYKVKIKETKLDPNKCYICMTVFANLNDVEVHLPKHAHMVPYDCEECKATRTEAKTIFTVIMLHRHFRMHAGSIKCPECAFRTCTGNGLYKHIKRSHMENTNTVYTSEVCGAKVKNIRVFENHLRMHKAIEEGRYTCEFCAKKFATKTRLKRHERIHTNERPYQCHYCSKSFINETTFHAHERSHTGEFHCSDCDQRFPTRQRLDLHSYVHTDSKPYCCDVCGKNFRSKKNFAEHMAAHSNIRPYSCTVCGMSFVREWNMKQHMLKHSDALTYVCHCGKKFRYRASLSKHEKIHMTGEVGRLR
ncbi:zinc finger protein 26-like [Ochlerotatus camptorhynchus]|uniref:zinc finger protein 26-like n=1 Tax=Ochlerotatus camptorhynchus TaxID=644619 RepID=UPI0031E31015